jgi:hypothetical protein
MKTTAFVLAVLAAVSMSACARVFGPAARTQHPNAKEVSILEVGLDRGGNCVLLENPPDAVVTHNTNQGGGGRIEWIVVGNCGDADEVGIRPILRLNGADRPDVLETNGTTFKIKAKHDGRIKLKIKGTPPAGDYEYQVLINDRPAEYASPADWGLFRICPEWPCGRRSATIDR